MYIWKYNADHAQLPSHHFHNICWSLGTQRCICCLILISHISIYISICTVMYKDWTALNLTSVQNVIHNNYLQFFLMKWDEKIISNNIKCKYDHNPRNWNILVYIRKSRLYRTNSIYQMTIYCTRTLHY